ncbi:MAG TPA: MarR family transcriptional regulator [Acidimicrobiales bacterium]
MATTPEASPETTPESTESTETTATTDATETGEGAAATPDERALPQFVERFALLLTDAGFPRMPARVLTRLLCDDDGRMTAGELAESLRVSPAAVSGAVRFLVQLGLVHREREPGARRDHYRVDADSWYESMLRRTELVTRWTDALADGAEVLGRDQPAGRRLEESRAFFQFLQEEVEGMMARWRAHRAATREERRRSPRAGPAGDGL